MLARAVNARLMLPLPMLMRVTARRRDYFSLPRAQPPDTDTYISAAHGIVTFC